VTNYSTHTSAEKSIPVKHVKQLCACLSSSCFWFYQQVYTDGMNLKLFEVENFPVPDFDNVSEVKLRQLAVLYDKYVDDIEKYARSHETSEASSYNIDNFKEYKIGYSKKIIDEIDDLIGPLYGLTREEIEFIKNYEIEFRMADYWTSEQMEEFISKRVDFIAGIGAEGERERRRDCAWRDQPGGGDGAGNRRRDCAWRDQPGGGDGADGERERRRDCAWQDQPGGGDGAEGEKRTAHRVRLAGPAWQDQPGRTSAVTEMANDEDEELE
jgi:hypothetical protein